MFLTLKQFAQNENSKWYFGNQAGLDFMTNPPTALSNGSISTSEGCSGISDALGNLLFYTDGITVWNSSHQIMANGSGLFGNSSTSQSAVVVKQPGNNNIYYVVTLACCNGSQGLNYSVVDMSLASGSGSVIAKNINIAGTSSERLTSVRHCNGTDIWILSQEWPSSNFRAHLVTSLGISSLPVISAIGTNSSSSLSSFVGYMKFSPNGKMLGVAIANSSNLGFEVYDFDASTGIVSNRLPLLIAAAAYGCEFSPDGTKFYGALWSGTKLYQWDLCAGTSTAIVASQYTTSTNGGGALQLGINGKIYMTRAGQSMMGVVANPNVAGAGCNYSDNGQSISPKTNTYGLPNFITSGFKTPPLPFTHTVSNVFGCQTASYTAPPIVQNFSLVNCAASGYSLNSMVWNFGDPVSGAANTSTVVNPYHTFSTLGTYTTQLILYYSCGGGTDTIRQVVNINQPCITVTSTSITCANLGSATVQATGGTGPYSYTWMPTGQTNPVATGLSPGSYTITVFDFGNNFTYSATALFTSLIPLSGLTNASNSVSCNGAATGTANVTSLNGGSGSQNYLWTNGVISYTAPNPTNLTAGNYTLTVTDALTGCSINSGFFISQPPAGTVIISSSSPTACAGASVALSGTVAGGLPAYNYSWTAGPASFSRTILQPTAGTYTYYLNTTDASGCAASGSIAIPFISNPVLNLNDELICPLQTATLNVIGASSYTWNGLYSGSSFTANPMVTSEYTVAGSANGCSAVATVSVILKALPIPTLGTNGPLCNGDVLLLNGSGGASYQWTGPSLFNSSLQNPSISPVALSNAGVYTATLTAANGCTAAASSTLVVNPTPTLSATGSTICTGQNLAFSGQSVPGATFLWTGPNSFNAAQQNILIPNAQNNLTGAYQLKVTSIYGCSNTAIAQANVVSPPTPFVSLSSGSICVQGLNGSPSTVAANFTGASTYTLSVPNFISNSNPNGPSSSLSLLAPNLNTGPVYISLQGSNGVCTAVSGNSFILVPNPTVSIGGPPPVICAGLTFTYYASGASTYNWMAANPANTLNASGNTAVVGPTTSAVFSVMGTALGCNSAIQSSTLTVNALPQLSINPNPARVCLGSSVNLAATGTASLYSWSPNMYLNATGGATVSASPPVTQNYMVVASLNSCTRSAVVTVSVLPVPTAGIFAPKTVFCAGDSVILYGSGASNYEWQGPQNFLATGKELRFMAFSGAYSGNYTLTVSDLNNCKGSTTQAITINNLPQGYLSSRFMEGCAPFCPQLVFKQAPNTSPISSMSWQVNAVVFTGTTFSHCFETPGTHIITGVLSDINSCANTLTSVVHVHPNPVADFYFNPETPVEEIDEILFTNASKGATDYYWEFGASKYTSTQTDPRFTFANIGIYPVALVARNQWQCADTMVKAIQVYPDFAVYIPNAFTPNEDGLNETFKPVISGVKAFDFSIFDRWGAKIFESTDSSKGWDGSFKGKACKNDVYIWKLTLSAENPQGNNKTSQQKTITGQVTLYR